MHVGLTRTDPHPPHGNGHGAPETFPLLRQLVYAEGRRRLDYRREVSQLTGLPELAAQPEALATEEARALIDLVGAERCLALLAAPVGLDSDGTLTVLVADPTTQAVDDLVRSIPGAKSVTKVVATDLDIARLVVALRGDHLLSRAISALARTAPEFSALRVMHGAPRAALAVVLFALVATAVIWPIPMGLALLAVLNSVFAANTVLKLVVGIAGLIASRRMKVTVPPTQGRDWPVYTILVPMYREPPQVVANLLAALERLDYPKDRLDVILLLEEDDESTLQSCKSLSPPGYVRLITVPPSLPRTKPKALNWGLLFAHGQYLTVYDAEDEPEPDQLKKAVMRFEGSQERLACLQAALNFYNVESNLLTRLFCLEYTAWFDNLIPGLRALGLAFPLGGTSNHFRIRALTGAGAWDPFNVTEDADLGFRLQRLGYRVSFLRSTTFEEASSRLHQWMRQRCRWIKGYMVTWIVHARRPLHLLREVGAGAWLSFHLLIGGTPLAFLAHIPLSVLMALSLVQPHWVEVLYPSWSRIPLASLWASGIAAGVGAAAIGLVGRRWWRLLPYCLLMPLYWLLHSAAAWWALWELLLKPYYWQRTPHGYHLPADRDRPEPEAAPLSRGRA